MSTRLYPLYQKGGPQLRVFLPNFWLKLVRPEREQPKNIVQFICSMEMSSGDVRNYLEKIYNLPIVHVRTRIAIGKTKKEPVKGYIIKEDDIKYAYVSLQKDEVFEFPNLFPTSKDSEKSKMEKSFDDIKKQRESQMPDTKDKPGTVGWFNSF